MEFSYSLVFAILVAVTAVTGEILTPPYFNLAEGSTIDATATCGENIATTKERFCRLTGASADEVHELSGSSYYSGDSQIIAGQLCDFCASEGSDMPSQVHSAQFAIDGTERWWQSPPLSRGSRFNDVNLTVNLGQEFHVAYVFIKMGNSPRPGVWTLERSTDNGNTWSPWQHFADSPADCMLFFNQHAVKKPANDTDVICTTEFSKIVPLESGEIAVSMVQDRPGSTDFSHAPDLQEFTRATNVRLSLQRAKTLQGHLMQLQRQDPTVTRRYFYSVKDISIGGRCVCNGHADTCDKKDQFKLVCECEHNTCGDNCDRCCEPYVQKKWRVATEDDPNVCEPCECFGHSNECTYDENVDRQGLSLDTQGKFEGGGVCQNCADNTEGINCAQCVHGYYRPVGKPLSDIDVCQSCTCDPQFTTGDCEDETGICECLEQYTGPNCRECAFGYYDAPICRPCDCFLSGTSGEVCEVGGAQCPCKDNFSGENCGQCAEGYWNFPECTSCSCAGSGAIDNACDKETSQCNCNFAFNGTECDGCSVGYFDYPKCSFCDCDTTGTEDGICDPTSGQCICEDNYTGDRCDQCADGFYSYPDCLACECDTTGTVNSSPTCNEQGQCQCLSNFGGKKCDACAPGNHNYPTCKSCGCSAQGSFGKSCDQSSAQCDCRQNFVGLKCLSCAANFYNYPTCEACLCNPAGAEPVEGFPLGGCGSFDDGYTLCECKANVEGHTCDQCRPGYYDLTKENADGCQACTCHLPGTLLGDNMCDPATGQCLCKVNVNSNWCQACIPGTYKLQESSVFGCEDCNCDIGGAVHDRCHSETGQCDCRPRVEGRTCHKPIANHYFPTLHQLKYELEDGYNPIDNDSAVRFGFDKNDFPEFSWRGYAVFSRIQPEVRIIVYINKPSSLFKLIFRYMNRNFASVKANVVVTPDDTSDAEQTATVLFPPTGSSAPEFLTTDSPLVLSNGKWTISIITDLSLEVSSDLILMDYLVLLPQAYYSGANLQDRLRNPCMAESKGRNSGECLHYTYLDLSKFTQQDGGDAVRPDGQVPLMETNRDLLLPLNLPKLATLDNDQSELVFNVDLKEPGKYVFVIGYISPKNIRQTLTVNMKPDGENATVGKVMIYECEYSSLCRQVVIDMDNGEQVLETSTSNVTVTIIGDSDTSASIGYVAAVPEAEWKDEMVKAQVMCVRVQGKCVQGMYPFLTGSIKMDVTVNSNVSNPPSPFPESADKRFVKLDTTNDVMITFNNLTSTSYAVVASYYQPNDVGFPVNLSVDVNGVMYTGYFDASYCPNTAGCNSLVTFDDIQIKNQIIDVLSQDAVITIRPLADEDNDVWIDFIQMVPTNDVERLLPQLELLDPYDLSGRYISECTGENFFVDAERGQITPFCRSSLFSVTTEYNNGALACDCDALGSEAFRCSEFGGQCRCKPNIIGRTCNACEQNYYGFPDCKPCNCPATCNSVTGACECPKRVTGPLCDQCVPQTFGYDRTIGCMDCSCQSRGVLNGNLDCDLDTGNCDCKSNVVGRQCDVCKNGHWNYPSCDSCNCDPAGTMETICDRESSKCSCKVNTGGDTCGDCQSGTYNLESRNHEGCTKCFCFGITSSCLSSSMLRSEVQNMSGWGFLNANGSAELDSLNDMVMATLNESLAAADIAMYWLAPEVYLGNKLTSYGGKFKFSVSNAGIDSGTKPTNAKLPGPAILISGKGLEIAYSLLSPILDEEIAVDVVETAAWSHARSGDVVTRDQLMRVLSSVDQLLVKANYYTNVTAVTLSSVSLDIAVDRNASTNSSGVIESFSSDIALTVEMCLCPPNYAGTSCEDCADGFFRKINDVGAFVCIPCECNGHSQTCDRETGVCGNCDGNTEGDHCEQCRLGYTGEPEFGVCTICACPMAIESNNFASTCVLSPDDQSQTIQCDCLPGFIAPFCGGCGPGYYGNPRNTSGGNCIPCECNGNIDVSDPGSCDSHTGDCLRCLNDTQGNGCEICKDFYWGDAINAKDCQKCDCDELGTDSCDKDTGTCMCKPNVIGDRCDQCANDTWGFLSGNGCSFCNCSIAANSSQCDIVTGDCPCQPGVTGKRCNSCLPQHWDFTAAGCKSCECALDGAVGCSVDTGICQCLQGVTGEKCDRCADRWVLIPEKGCEACDNCVHTLLDDTDELQFDIANASTSLYIINIGVEARKRLELLNSTIPFIKSQLENVPRRSLNPVEIDALTDNLTTIQELATKTLKEARQVETISNAATKSYEVLQDTMSATEASKVDALREIDDILDYIRQRYEDILNSENLRDVSKLLKEAQEMLAEIQRNHQDVRELLNDARAANSSAQATLDRVQEWSNDNKNLTDRFNQISDSLNDMKNRLVDLQQKAAESLARSTTAEEHLADLKELISELQQSTVDINAMKETLEKTIEEADQFTTEAEDYIVNATNTFKKLEEDLTILDGMVDNLNVLFTNLSAGNLEARPKVDAAMAHADSLKIQAVDLSILLMEASRAAVAAADSYNNMVKSINEAMNASRDALDMAMKATQQSTDIRNNTEQVKADSLELLDEAERLKNETSHDLRDRLEKRISAMEGLEMKNDYIEQKYDEVQFHINNLRKKNKADAEEARKLARDSLTKAEDAVGNVQPILDNLQRDANRVVEIPILQEQMDINIQQIRSKMDTINSLLPNVTSLTKSLKQMLPDWTESRENLSSSIATLKQSIEKSRAIANRIKVALKSDENTTVQLRAPEGFIDSLQQQTELTLFFQTEEANGLLLYIGPKATTSDARTRQGFMSVEYLAIELVDGHVMWKYNLGSDSAVINSTRKYNDGNWHQVIALRQGKEGTLTVRTHDKKDDRVEGSAGGFFNQLDLVPKATYMFAGGVPDDFDLPEEVVNRRFIGGLDDYAYSENNIRLGMWNFVGGQENNKGILDRGGELAPEVSNSVRFVDSSQSYITIDKGTLSASKKFAISFKFRTLKKDGIIFFMGQDRSESGQKPDYFKVYMKYGKVYVTCELGGGAILLSYDVFTADGNEHQVNIERQYNIVRIKVDSGEPLTVTGPVSAKQLNIGTKPELHIGGIPKDSKYYGEDVADHPYFDGCVSDLSLNQNPRNILVKYLAKVGTVQGCKLVKRGVTFKEASDDDIDKKDEGFVQVLDDVVTVGENFSIGMDIKTLAEDGLLFYASSVDDKYAFSVAMVAGKIKVVNTAGSERDGTPKRNELETKNPYNDGAWHHISIIKESLKISIVVDDIDHVDKIGDHRGKKTKTETQFGYFLGGLRQSVLDSIQSKDNSPIWQRFIGCMSDVFIMKVKVDFATSRPEGGYADYSACPIPDPIDELSTAVAPTTSSIIDLPKSSPTRCVLPQTPNVTDVLEQGTRFGLNEDSRFEFTTIAGFADIRKGLRLNNNMKFMVKTFATEGMIWFMGDKRLKANDSPDYTTIYLEEGKVVYKCNLGSGAAVGISSKAINDGLWHSIEISRQRTSKILSGFLTIDDEEPINATWPIGASSLNFELPIYVGGLDMKDDRYDYMAEKFGQASVAGLVGCIDNLEYRGKEEGQMWIPFGQELNKIGVQGCFENQEDGVFIPSTESSLALGKETLIGLNTEVELSVRPRSNSGVIFLVWGDGDYLGIELIGGTVQANIDNGAGDIKVSIDVPDICDGQWRKINVIKKGNVLTLIVKLDSEDATESLETMNIGSTSEIKSADTNSPVYVGGIPAKETVGSRYTPLSGPNDYVGCIRGVSVGKRKFNTNRGRKIGDVERTCPTT